MTTDPDPSIQQTGGVNVNAGGNASVRVDTLVGRDQIITNIQNIVQRVVSAVELADQARDSERRLLGQGLQVLAERLQHDAVTSDVTDRNPFKGLLPYRLSDAELFYGRGPLIQQLWRSGKNHSLTILQSESGAGKSSLLMAGLSPRLIVAGHLPVYVRAYNALPSQAIRRAFIPDLTQSPILAAAPLRETLWQVCQILGPQSDVWLLLDQFEEFFTLLAVDQQTAFVQELGECLDDPRLSGQVHWVLALRTEYFGRLDGLRPRIENPFGNHLTLPRLTRASATEVILNAIAGQELSFEPGLLEQVLNELSQNGDEIAPPQLQLVGSALYSAIEGTVFTSELYHSKGGVKGILNNHLREALKQLGPDQPSGRRVLEALTTADNTRLRRSRADLATDPTLQSALGVLDTVLARLVKARVVTVTDSDDTLEATYELAHDYLLNSLTLEPEIQARKAAQELLDKEVSTFRRYGTLMTADLLNVVVPFRAELRLDDTAQKLLEQSQAAVEQEAREKEEQRQRELEYAKQAAAEAAKRANEEQARRKAETVALRLTQAVAIVLLTVVLGGIGYFIGLELSRQNARAAAPLQQIVGQSTAFEIYEVSNARYKLCVENGPCSEPALQLSTYFSSSAEALPVTGVDALQAAKFCAWLGRRLPTRAEWEQVAAQGPQPWDEGSTANLDFETGAELKPRAVTVAASDTPNSILNLYGNVWEWTTTPSDTNGTPGLDTWNGQPDSVPDRLFLLGGSYTTSRSNKLLAHAEPTIRTAGIGFRCVENVQP